MGWKDTITTEDSSVPKKKSWKDTIVTAPEESDGGVLQTGLDILTYPGRVTRTGVAAALSPDISASDVAEQAGSVFDKSVTSKAPSMGDVYDIANKEIRLPAIGVNPDFAGNVPKDVGITEAVLGKKPLSYSELPSGERIEKRGIYDIAEPVGEGLLDVSNILPVGKIAEAAGKGVGLGSKAIKGLGGATAEGAKALAGSALKGTGEALQAVKSEGVLGSASRGIGKTIGSSLERLSPKMSAKLPKMLKTAESIGLAAEDVSDAIKFGGDSDISRNYRVLLEMPGNEAAREAHNATTFKIRQGLENTANSISKGRTSQIVDSLEAGEKLTKDFQDAQNAIRKQIDYDRGLVYEKNPEIKFTEGAYESALDVLDQASKKAEELSKQAIDPTIVQQSQKVSNILADSFRNMSQTDALQNVHKEIQKLGEIAFGDAGARAAPQVKKALRDAYFGLSEVYDNNTKDLLGKDIAKKVEEGNRLWKEWYKSGEDFSRTLASGDDAEKVYKRLIRSGGSKELKNYKDFMLKANPEGLEDFKSLLVKDLINDAKTQSGFSFGRLADKIKDPDVSWKLKIFFTPEEITKFKDIADLGLEHGDAIFNTSRTSTADSIKNIGKTAKERAQLEAMQDYLKNKAQGIAPKAPEVPTSMQTPEVVSDVPAPVEPSLLEKANMLNKGKIAVNIVQSAAARKEEPQVTKGAKLLDIPNYKSSQDMMSVDPMMAEQIKAQLPDADLTNTEKATIAEALQKGKVSRRVLEFLQGPAMGPNNNMDAQSVLGR